jgi:uncharacterized hydrophobic protein (TIGR00271 family)
MRQLIVQVPRGQGKIVLNLARSCEGVNLVQWEASSNGEPVDLVLVHLSNDKVETFLAKLQDLLNPHVTLFPTGVMALRPPADQAPQQAKNVADRSPIEIFLGGLQSIGSWRGFLGYAAVAGVVVWIGLYTNTTYLLVAAMLIAPFVGPAMNVAIATARGDRQLLWRSLVRYFVALLLTIAITATLSLLLRQQIATPLMIDQSQVSAVAVLLPLAAGAAGAINLVQSERSSLVSGAATGMLVAASLAPPAGILGMASAIGRWDMVSGSGFLLLLQLVGINLTAALLFRVFGLSSRGARYSRGKRWLFPIALLITLMALAGLLVWQFLPSPNLERASLAQRANSEITTLVEQNPLVDLVEANVRFTRSNIPDQNTLLAEVYVQRRQGVTKSDDTIGDRLSATLQRQLLQQASQQGLRVTPLIDVTVLEPLNQNS